MALRAGFEPATASCMDVARNLNQICHALQIALERFVIPTFSPLDALDSTEVNPKDCHIDL